MRYISTFSTDEVITFLNIAPMIIPIAKPNMLPSKMNALNYSKTFKGEFFNSADLLKVNFHCTHNLC